MLTFVDEFTSLCRYNEWKMQFFICPSIKYLTQFLLQKRSIIKNCHSQTLKNKNKEFSFRKLIKVIRQTLIN